MTIMNSDKILMCQDVKSLFLKGDRGEFEILENHSPLIGVLTEGDIIIDWDKAMPITRGIVRVYNNECMILIDKEHEESMPKENQKK